MAKRLTCVGVGAIDWLPMERVELGSGQVRVRNEYGAEKHGTMQAFVKGYANERGRWDVENRMHGGEGVLWNYPIPLGNMQVGRVVEVGPEARGIKVGDRVAASAPFEPESVIDPTDCFLLPDAIDWRDAMLQDPGEYAMGAIRDGHLRLGDTVAVFGMGAIGLVTVQMARAAGASRIIAVDTLKNRRSAAFACGADHVIDGTVDDVGGQVRKLTGMQGVDVAIDFSGARSALQAAIRGVAYEGTIVCGAFPAPYGAGLDFGGEAHMNRPKIVFSRACSDPNPDHPRWDWARIRREVWSLICAGRLSGSPIVDVPVPFASLLDTYPRIAAHPEETIKLSVSYGPSRPDAE